MSSSPRRRADLLLLLPGVTEARHFPYLSLPQLTAYCRALGYEVVQRDHNIGLSRALLTPEALTRRLGFPSSLSPLRTATLRYLLDRTGPLPPVATDVDTRIELNGLDAMLAGSAVISRVRRLEELVAVARTPLAAADVAGRLYERLVAETLRDVEPRMVGFSVAFFSQLVPAVRSAVLIRRLAPDATIVFGGQQIMMRKEALERCPGLNEIVDHLVDEADERSLPALLEGRTVSRRPATPPEGGPQADVAGKSRGWRFQDNPPPDFTGLPLDDYFARPRQLPVLSCIGCYWAKCSFCSYGNRSLRQGYQQLDHRTLARSAAVSAASS